MENPMAAGRIIVTSHMPVLDLNGRPVAGAKIAFYENETTTLATVYTSAALNVAHPNPVTANAAGMFPSIFADEAEAFSITIEDADGAPIAGLRNLDNVRPTLFYGQDVVDETLTARDGAIAARDDTISGLLTKASKAGDTFTGRVKIDRQALEPPQYPGIAGALGTEGDFLDLRRVGGYGSYGYRLVTVHVDTAIETGQLDCAQTAWITATDMDAGSIGVFGGWTGANSPSSDLGHTWGGGSVVGSEVNVGNRWGDLGLKTTLTGQDIIGQQIVPDVIPAADGETEDVYPGTFGSVRAPSIHGHRWWVGDFTAYDAIVATGHAHLTSGGSSAPNAPASGYKLQGHFVNGIDFSDATISGAALKWSDISLLRPASQVLRFANGAGDRLFQVIGVTGANSHLSVVQGTDLLTIDASGATATNVGLDVLTKGSGKHRFASETGSKTLVEMDDVTSGQTALLVRTNDGAVTSVRRVTVGAADSGGSGYRVLRVTN